MNKTRMVFAQMQQLISTFHFKKAVKEYRADKNVRTFSTWNLLQVMMFSHITQKRSLRDICTGLQSVRNHWYHIGLGSVSRNNLSHSLSKRSHEVFENTFYHLLSRFQHAFSERKDNRFRFKNNIKAIDSTSISLCMSLYAWASYRSTKSGIKVHTMYDVKKRIPDFMVITDGRSHDHTVVKQMPIEENTIYVLDRGYLCFQTLEKIDKKGAFFVTRTKSNTRFRTISRKKPIGDGILRDDCIIFTGQKAKDYPHVLRLVRYRDPETKKQFSFIANNMDLSARTIASIYKSRWDIELFFKWVKQNLKVKTFIGTSENAVRIQIWTAAIVYLVMEYIRFCSRTCFALIDVFRIIGTNIFSDRAIDGLLMVPKQRLKRKYTMPELQLDMAF